jgi:hypothetical protein
MVARPTGDESMSMQTKYLLGEGQMPRFWYNIQPKSGS